MRLVHPFVMTGGVLMLVAALQAAPVAQASNTEIKAQIQKKLDDLKIGRSRVMFDVMDRVVTLDGTIPTLWAKMQLIDTIRKLQGVMEVRSTLQIPKAESDNQLADDVGKQIRGYARLSVVDYVDGNVNNGVVTLSGAVTAPEKVSELGERIEKIAGVQDLKNNIRVLPTSRSDDRIRAAIATQIYADPIFIQYSRANPPIHIIVENGRVQLLGFVRSQLERQKAYEIARSVSGVFDVDNQIHTPQEIK